MPTLITPKLPKWYTKEGEPLWEIKAKTTSGMRPVTLRDARQLHLLPSVTTVLQVIAKPQLEAWKITQGIVSALTLPRLENEPLEAFAKRVVKDSEEEVSEAADFGSTIHHAIEAHLTGDCQALQQLPPDCIPYLNYFIKWQEQVNLLAEAKELIVVNMLHGYAGQLDFVGSMTGHDRCVIDFKTQKVRNGKAEFYDEWVMQLAAYAHAYMMQFNINDWPALVSVVINSIEPSPIQVKVWDEPGRHIGAFLQALNIWKYLKNYDPCAA